MKPLFNLYDGRALPLLPAYSKPYEDETMSSWLTRLAIDHQINIRTFLRVIWPKFELLGIDIDMHAPDLFLRELAIRTNCSYQLVKQTTLPSMNNIRGKHSLYVTKGAMLGAVGNDQVRGQMFCPVCLSSGIPYYRKSWRLSIMVACTSCGCYLHDQCPICKSGIGFSKIACKKSKYLSIVQCSSCGFDLRKTKPKLINDDILAIHQDMHGLFKSESFALKKYKPSYFYVLYRMMGHMCRKDQRFVLLQKDVASIIGLPCKKMLGYGRHRYDLMNVEERIIAMRCANWLLQEWPERFIKYFRKHYVTMKYALNDMDYAPKWYADVVKRNLWIRDFCHFDIRNKYQNEERALGMLGIYPTRTNFY